MPTQRGYGRRGPAGLSEITADTDTDLTGILQGNGTKVSALDNAALTTKLANDCGMATKAYADALIVGLLSDRGNFNASGNTFPGLGGGGTAGAIRKGDLWTISVAGTLGGQAVTPGDVVRALVDAPGQTASNWAITENNFGYVAENTANKSSDSALGASNTLYPTQGAVKGYVDTGLATKQNSLGFTPLNPANNLSELSNIATARKTLLITEPSADLVGSFDALCFPSVAWGNWHWGGWIPGNGAIASHNLIVVNHLGTGTLTTADSTITNYRTMQKRSVLTSAASAGSVAHVRTASLNSSVVRGNASNIGGFFYKYTFGVESAITGSRLFVGLRGLTTTPATGTEPSAAVNCIILGWDSGDTNLQIMHNDAAGTCTKIDLGSSFPANTANTVYTLYLFSEPNGSAIYYEVRRRDSAAVASGTINTDLPANTTFMVPHHWGDNGPTATAIPLNVVKLDIWWKMH